MNRVSQLLLTITLVTMSSCGDSTQPTEHNTEQTSIAVPLSKTAADEIASAEVVVTGPDISLTRQALIVSGREISGTIPRVEPGPSRTFTMNAYDATGVLIYSGGTTVDIAEGESAQVSITLRRVEPTIAPERVFHELPDDTDMELMRVPAGEFTRGSGDHPDPIQVVYVSEFYMGKLEVTFAQAASWLHSRGNNEYPAGEFEGQNIGEFSLTNANNILDAEGLKLPELAEHPAFEVSWMGANEYCRWAGLRLPTEAEWEKAARGTDKRVFPWGARLDSSRANYRIIMEKTTTVVGSYPEGRSPYGVLDMSGNVSEWVADWHVDGAYFTSSLSDPQGPPADFGNAAKVVRGGHYNSAPGELTTYDRKSAYFKNSYKELGFRCARD